MLPGTSVTLIRRPHAGARCTCRARSSPGRAGRRSCGRGAGALDRRSTRLPAGAMGKVRSVGPSGRFSSKRPADHRCASPPDDRGRRGLYRGSLIRGRRRAPAEIIAGLGGPTSRRRQCPRENFGTIGRRQGRAPGIGPDLEHRPFGVVARVERLTRCGDEAPVGCPKVPTPPAGLILKELISPHRECLPSADRYEHKFPRASVVSFDAALTRRSRDPDRRRWVDRPGAAPGRRRRPRSAVSPRRHRSRPARLRDALRSRCGIRRPSGAF